MNIINISIYRIGDDDCTNNGLSSKAARLPLVVLGYCETAEDAIHQLINNHQDPNRYLLLVRRELWGENHDYLKPLTETRWVMAGGNYGYTSDSRFRELTGSWLPLPIHDRVED